MAKAATTTQLKETSPAAGQRWCTAAPVAKRKFSSSQTASGEYSGGGGCPGFLLMSEGVANARMSSAVTAQPKKLTQGVLYQSILELGRVPEPIVLYVCGKRLQADIQQHNEQGGKPDQPKP